MNSLIWHVTGKDIAERLSSRRISLIEDFVASRNINWRYIDTGMTRISGCRTKYTCGTGETFTVESKPLWTSGDTRRAVFRQCDSQDLLLEEIYGGYDALITRLGHIVMVLPVKENTEKWSRVLKELKTRSTQN